MSRGRVPLSPQVIFFCSHPPSSVKLGPSLHQDSRCDSSCYYRAYPRKCNYEFILLSLHSHFVAFPKYSENASVPQDRSFFLNIAYIRLPPFLLPALLHYWDVDSLYILIALVSAWNIIGKKGLYQKCIRIAYNTNIWGTLESFHFGDSPFPSF